MPPIMDVVLTREQVRRVDRIAIEELGIPGLILMENAGRNAAAIILERIAAPAQDPIQGVVVFCGTGNNGGDGFVIARHLVNAGITVRIALAGRPDRLTPDADANYRICKNMSIPIAPPDQTDVNPDDLIVDALLGTGFTSQVRDDLAAVIHQLNDTLKRAVIAIDVPSGLDCNTGQPSNATVIADATITFVADKTGFQAPGANRYTGPVHVADIGAPPTIILRVTAP